jgi:hypothetical protein
VRKWNVYPSISYIQWQFCSSLQSKHERKDISRNSEWNSHEAYFPVACGLKISVIHPLKVCTSNGKILVQSFMTISEFVQRGRRARAHARTHTDDIMM